eukprot:gene18204-biopygen5287
MSTVPTPWIPEDIRLILPDRPYTPFGFGSVRRIGAATSRAALAPTSPNVIQLRGMAATPPTTALRPKNLPKECAPR